MVIKRGDKLINSSEVQHLQLKYVATINDDILAEDTNPDYELQYIDISNVDYFGNIKNIHPYHFKDAPKSARRVVQKGDVIISTIHSNPQTIALIQDVPENLVVSTNFAVIRPKANVFDSNFCKYVLQESTFLNEVKMRSKDLISSSIKASDLGDIRINLPSIQQQHTIANCLNHETARLNDLVVANNRLLKLVEEKQMAIITHAITRGINPDVPLHDSGLPWIEKIPSHWTIGKLKHLATLKSGKTITSESITEMGEYAVFGRNGQMGFTSSFTHEGQYLLIVRHGSLCGNVHIASDHFWASEQVIIVDLKKGYDIYWLEEVLRAMNLNQYSESTSLPMLNIDFVANLQVPIPPVIEQRNISTHIKTEIEKLEQLKEAAEHIILLLKERHAALITTAMTKNIKVV